MAIQQVTSVTPVTAKSPVAGPREVSAEQARAPEASQAPATPTVQPSREQIDRAMNEVRRAVAPVARNLQFSIDDETGRTVVKIVDSSTNEVIRQIPSEDLLAITRSMDKLSGLFVKQKV